jgi:hypothetical protein
MNIMSGFLKAGIYPLNPGQITDRLTAPSKIYSTHDQDDDNACTNYSGLSDSTSADSTVTHIGNTNATDISSIASGGSSQVFEESNYLNEILLLPCVKTSKSSGSARSINSIVQGALPMIHLYMRLK